MIARLRDCCFRVITITQSNSHNTQKKQAGISIFSRKRNKIFKHTLKSSLKPINSVNFPEHFQESQLGNKNICFCQGIKSIALNCILMSIGRLYYYETLKNSSKKEAKRVHTHALLII